MCQNKIDCRKKTYCFYIYVIYYYLMQATVDNNIITGDSYNLRIGLINFLTTFKFLFHETFDEK